MLKEFIDRNEIKNALLGTIIADGYISKKRTKNANCNLEITHTSKNLDYLKELKYLIESIDGIKCTIQEHNKNSENKDLSRLLPAIYKSGKGYSERGKTIQHSQ